jgi:hypothetical protein
MKRTPVTKILCARLLFGVAIAALLLSAREAAAYPQFQFSSGTTRCGQCHYSPTGGTLITSWGRDESGDTLSLGGDGAFLHGAWTPPSWLALGVDLRYAGVTENVGGPEAPESAWFPMQADAYARVAFSDAISLNVTVGARGVVRPVDPSISGRINDIGTRTLSREHYLMWRPSATGPYVRVGKFKAPYGINFVEHIYFIRRYTGFNLYEETYNASGGYVADDWEVHASVFTPPPESAPNFIRSVGFAESGGTLYGEKRFASMASVALQTRIGIASEEARYQGGAIGKLWVDKAKLLFLTEGDFIRQEIKAASFGQNQFAGYAGVTFFPTRGLMAGLAYERWQENLSVAGTGRNAYDAQINFFPWAHFELLLLGRYQPAASTGTDTHAATLGMLQIHYYL